MISFFLAMSIFFALSPTVRYLQIRLSSVRMKKVKLILWWLSISYFRFVGPPESGATMIEQSIVILPDHPLSSPTRCFIQIDRKLLSTDNGTLLNYLIYVRQSKYNEILLFPAMTKWNLCLSLSEDQENNFTQPHLDGTYSDALRNQSIDYLALDIPLATSASKLGISCSFRPIMLICCILSV